MIKSKIIRGQAPKMLRLLLLSLWQPIETACGKVGKFSTQVDDSLNIDHSNFPSLQHHNNANIFLTIWVRNEMILSSFSLVPCIERCQIHF